MRCIMRAVLTVPLFLEQSDIVVEHSICVFMLDDGVGRKKFWRC